MQHLCPRLLVVKTDSGKFGPQSAIPIGLWDCGYLQILDPIGIFQEKKICSCLVVNRWHHSVDLADDYDGSKTFARNGGSCGAS